MDNFTGTAGNDTFIADNTVSAQLSAADQLNGGAGVDTLKLYVGNYSAPGTIVLPTGMKDIENLEVTHDDSDDFTLNAGAAAGLESIKLTSLGTANDITVNTNGNATSVSVTGGADVTISDASTTDKLASVTIDGSGLTAAAAISSDALTSLTIKNAAANATVTAAAGTRELSLNLEKATTGTVSDNAATSLKINATGADSTGVTLVAGAAKNVAFSGDKKVTIANQTIDAAAVITSSNTAGVILSTALANGVTFTGGDGDDSIGLGASTKVHAMGAGKDTVVLTGSVLGTDGKVDGGEGVDTLGMTGANAATASASTSVANFSGKVTGFEILSLASGAGTIDIGNLNNSGWNAINKVVYTNALGGASTLNNLASGGTVEYQATAGSATTINVKDAATGTDDVINLKVTGSAGVNANTITVANVETVNLETDDSAATPSGIAHTMILMAAQATKLTVSGDAGVTLTLTGSTALTDIDTSGVTKGAVSVTTVATNKSVTMTGGNTDTTFDASSITDNTKVATITTGSGDDTITGGAGDDTINAGNGTNSITGGGGKDTMTGGSGVDTYVYSAVTDSQGTKVDVITNFQVGTGGDVIDLSAVTGGSGAYLGAANGYGAVLTSLTGTAGDVVLDSSTSTLYIDVDGDAALTNADMAIQLTGVTGGLVATNFTF